MRNILEVKNLVRSYNTATFRDSKNNVNVLKGISFQVAEGEFVGIMGKSGCGKTTLLKTLGMIDKPTDGTIKFMGEDTSELYGDKLADIRNSKIGFIFQDFYLMDSLSVEENIMLPMIIIIKECLLSGGLPVICGTIISILYCSMLLYAKHLQIEWVHRYFKGIILIVGAIWLLFAVFIFIFAYRNIRKIEGDSGNGKK